MTGVCRCPTATPYRRTPSSGRSASLHRRWSGIWACRSAGAGSPSMTTCSCATESGPRGTAPPPATRSARSTPTTRPPPSTPSGRVSSWPATSRRASAMGEPGRTWHRDLGLVADLGGVAAVARPLGVPLTGPAAKLVAKAYHLYALLSAANRIRVGADWLTNLVSRPIAAQLGLVEPAAAQLAREQTGAGAIG